MWEKDTLVYISAMDLMLPTKESYLMFAIDESIFDPFIKVIVMLRILVRIWSLGGFENVYDV